MILTRIKFRIYKAYFLLVKFFVFSFISSAFYSSYAIAEQGHFELVHSSPIFQDITRIAFAHIDGSSKTWINFSTLESYHRNPNGDRFLLVSCLDGGNCKSTVVEGSTEGRSFAFSETHKAFVIGASLDPQIFLFDPRNLSLKHIFKGPGIGMWLHRLAVHGNFAYAIFSTPLPSVAGYEGIIKLNLTDGKHQLIPFEGKHPQGYGGVQTVDTIGRIWFYRAFPLKQMWFDEKGGMRERKIAGYESWTVESWDNWGERFSVLLTNRNRKFVKKYLDTKLLTPLDYKPPLPGCDESIFLESLAVDLYSHDKRLYFYPKENSFYIRIGEKMNFLGIVDLGNLELSGFNNEPQESPLIWKHPNYGELEVLGLSSTQELIIWLRGRKIYGFVNFRNGEIKFHEKTISNLSPSNITALTLGPRGNIYGGGYLTMCHIFDFDVKTRKSRLLNAAIPLAEGQINAMFTGWDGKVYGAAYPDAILFRYDPSRPWNPGTTLKHNPINLGPMGHYRQMRAFKGVQDFDGNIWFQSVTDFSVPIAHALTKANFNQKTMMVKTDLDDGFPEVTDLIVFDKEHLLLLGKSSLFVLNQKSFQIIQEKPLQNSGGLLLQSQGPILIQGKNVFRVRKDLSLELLHLSDKPIVRAVVWDKSQIILLGQAHMEKLDVNTKETVLWWEGLIFRDLTWAPVVSLNGRLYLADQEKLFMFVPPGEN